MQTRIDPAIKEQASAVLGYVDLLNELRYSRAHQSKYAEAGQPAVAANWEKFMPTPEYRSTWATYQAAWEEVNSAERQDLLGKSVADDCVYSDPTGQCKSRVEIVTFIEQFRKSMPGASFRNHSFLDHHAQSIADWTLYQAGAEIPGTSWARFGEDGRITNVSGFFEVPESAP